MSIKIIIAVIFTFLLGVYFYNQDVSLIENNTQQNRGVNDHIDDDNSQHESKPVEKLTNTIKPKMQNEASQASAIADTIARFKANQDRTQLQDSLIEDHEQFKRYPEGNAAIADAQRDPVLQRYEVDERTTMNEDKSAGLTIWSDKKFYLKDETVNIYAFIQNNEGKKLAVNLTANLLGTNQQKITPLTFDNAGNNLYQARIPLAQLSSSQITAGIYKVLVNNTEYKITDALTFTLTQPDIELTGEYKDSIDNEGRLIIQAQVLASTSSQYYIQASLYSGTQVPIGVTQSSTQLNPGLHWLPLSFSGQMIKDAGESGPYVLKNVSLAKVTIPMMRAPLIQPGFITDSYALDEFNR